MGVTFGWISGLISEPHDRLLAGTPLLRELQRNTGFTPAWRVRDEVLCGHGPWPMGHVTWLRHGVARKPGKRGPGNRYMNDSPSKLAKGGGFPRLVHRAAQPRFARHGSIVTFGCYACGSVLLTPRNEARNACAGEDNSGASIPARVKGRRKTKRTMRQSSCHRLQL